MTLKEIEQKVILSTLKKFDWNRTYAAKHLGLSVRTIRNKIIQYKKLGIKVK